MSLQYVDFVPRLLQAEPAFSTLSLTGDVPGPRYEEFDCLMQRANDWLAKVRSVEPISCDVIEIDGVYNNMVATETVDPPTDSKALTDSKKAMPAFLRVLRLWYRRMEEWRPLDASQERLVLDYANLMPPRLESTPRAFGPKFMSLKDTMETVNRRLRNDPDTLRGKILNMQTCVCRFSTKHCGIDPDRTFWMASNTEDMHICYFFRVFTLRSKRKPPQCQIGYKDFTPRYDWKSRRRREQQPDSFQDLMIQAEDWLRSLSDDNHLLNCQTLDHHAYFRCVRDTPGHESRVLDNPHFRSTQWGQMDYAKMLRVYHVQYDPAATQGESSHNVPARAVAAKTFHVQPYVAIDHLNFGAGGTPDLPLTHSPVMYKINDWIKATGVTLMGAETIKVSSNLTKVALSAEDTIFQSANRGRCYMLLAIKIYFWKPDNRVLSKPLDLSPEPKTVRFDEESCLIL